MKPEAVVSGAWETLAETERRPGRERLASERYRAGAAERCKQACSGGNRPAARYWCAGEEKY